MQKIKANSHYLYVYTQSIKRLTAIWLLLGIVNIAFSVCNIHAQLSNHFDQTVKHTYLKSAKKKSYIQTDEVDVFIKFSPVIEDAFEKESKKEKESEKLSERYFENWLLAFKLQNALLFAFENKNTINHCINCIRARQYLVYYHWCLHKRDAITAIQSSIYLYLSHTFKIPC